jgi:hypothetical protein
MGCGCCAPTALGNLNGILFPGLWPRLQYYGPSARSEGRRRAARVRRSQSAATGILQRSQKIRRPPPHLNPLPRWGRGGRKRHQDENRPTSPPTTAGGPCRTGCEPHGPSGTGMNWRLESRPYRQARKPALRDNRLRQGHGPSGNEECRKKVKIVLAIFRMVYILGIVYGGWLIG